MHISIASDIKKTVSRRKTKISGDRIITQFLVQHTFEPYCGHFEPYFDRKFIILGGIGVSCSAFLTESKNRTFGQNIVHILNTRS